MGGWIGERPTAIQADQPQFADDLDGGPCLGHLEALGFEHLGGFSLDLQPDFDDFQGVGEDHLVGRWVGGWKRGTTGDNAVVGGW